MKRFVFAAVLFFLSVPPLFAGSTGDDALDWHLNQINEAVRWNVTGYAHELGYRYGIPPQTVDELLTEFGMTPADMYMTVRIYRYTGRDIHSIADHYRRHKKGGWGKIAKELGIKPGSREFHALKAGKWDDDLWKDGKYRHRHDDHKGRGKGSDDALDDGHHGRGKGSDDAYFDDSPGKGKGKGKKKD